MKPSLAATIAALAHHGQVDKCGLPYVEHCRRVAEQIDDDDARVVAWLHDVLEDTDWPIEMLRDSGLTAEQEEGLVAMTRIKGPDIPKESEPDYLGRVVEVPIAIIVKRADIGDNANPLRLGVLGPHTRQRLARKAILAWELIGSTTDVEALGLCKSHPWYTRADGSIYVERLSVLGEWLISQGRKDEIVDGTFGPDADLTIYLLDAVEAYAALPAETVKFHMRALAG